MRLAGCLLLVLGVVELGAADARSARVEGDNRDSEATMQGVAVAVNALSSAGGSQDVASRAVPPPAVRVVDAGGNGVSGATVTFSVTAGSGRLAPAVVANVDAVYRTGGTTLLSSEAKAIFFTTGPSATAVSRIAVMFNSPTSAYPAPLQARVALHAVSGGNPGTVLAQSEVVSLTLSAPREWHVLTLPTLTLTAGQSYALVLSNPGGTSFRWANTDSSFEPTVFSGGTYDGSKGWNPATSQWDTVTANNAFVLGADVGDATSVSVTTSTSGVATLGGWTMGATPGLNTVTALHAVGAQTFSITGVPGPATQLAVTQAPVGGASGSALVTQPIVAVRDAQGNTRTDDSATVVTASLQAGAGGMLGGTLTATAVNGVATFSGITLTGLVGTNHTLRFSAAGLSSADAAGLTLTAAGPATQMAAASAQAQSTTVGTAVSARPSVAVRDAAGNGVAGIPVTFAVTGGGGSVTGGVVSTNTAGLATVGAWTVGTALGSHTLQATAAGLTGSPQIFTATAVAVIPAVPTAVSVSARDRALVVRWQAPVAASDATPTAYVLQSRALPDGAWIDAATLDATARQATVPGLTNGTAYEVRIASENSGGRSAWSSTVEGRPYRIDLRVAEVRPESPTSYRVTLQWTYDGAATTGFVVEGAAAGEARTATAVGAVTLWRGMVAAGRYSARVRLPDDEAGENVSNEVQVTADLALPPATPTDLRATVEGSRVTLAWVQALTAGIPEQHYLVVSGIADPIPAGPGSSVTFTGVATGTYPVQIAAANAAGVSALSAPVTVQVPGGCVAPQTPAWVSVGLENGVSLASWETASSGGAATDYLVTVDGLGVYATSGVNRISGRLGAGEYRIRVQAQNACGVSDPSAVQVLRVP
jgi:hypothetical protein